MATRHRTQVSRGNDGESPYKLAFERLSTLSARSGSSSNRQIRTMRDYSLIPFLFGVSVWNFYARRWGCRNRLFYKNPLKLLLGEDLKYKFICFHPRTLHSNGFSDRVSVFGYWFCQLFFRSRIDDSKEFLNKPSSWPPLQLFQSLMRD